MEIWVDAYLISVDGKLKKLKSVYEKLIVVESGFNLFYLIFKDIWVQLFF